MRRSSRRFGRTQRSVDANEPCWAPAQPLPTAFAEFIWSDFFRRNIAVEDVRPGFQVAVRTGIALAQSKWATRVPGYNGK